jgi:hypothetical protein
MIASAAISSMHMMARRPIRFITYLAEASATHRRHCNGPFRSGSGPSLISMSASWTCASNWAEIAHVDRRAANRAIAEMVQFDLSDAVCINA